MEIQLLYNKYKWKSDYCTTIIHGNPTDKLVVSSQATWAGGPVNPQYLSSSSMSKPDLTRILLPKDTVCMAGMYTVYIPKPVLKKQLFTTIY